MSEMSTLAGLSAPVIGLADENWLGEGRPSRPVTAETRLRAVRRVIAVMRERYSEPLSLEEMSRIAVSSSFHFNRVFRGVTGVPPLRFLAAIRLQAAKRLLLTTCRTVTDICFEVGYSSLGTFTTHFSEYVGTSPNRFRQMTREATAANLRPTDAPRGELGAVGATIYGTIQGEVINPQAGVAVIGLFQHCLPRSRPTACTISAVGDNYVIDRVKPGSYHLFAVFIAEKDADLDLYLGHSMPRARIGPLRVQENDEMRRVDLRLRPPCDTDPPLVIALPLLMAERNASRCALVAAV